METLDVEFSDRQAVVSAYALNGSRGTLSVSGDPPFPTGTTLRVKLRIANAQRSFEFEARVAWTRFIQNDRTKPGYGLELLDGKSGAEARFVAFLKGDVAIEAVRMNERVKTRLSLKIGGLPNPEKKVALDLSAGGLFAAIPVGTLPSKGTEVTLSVRPPLSLLPLRLKGRVAWQRPAGTERGVGVEFLFGSATERSKVERLVKRLSRKRAAS